MLMNNLDPEVAERPDDLVVYGGTGKAARNWEAYDALVRTLQTLKSDETMLVQSGKPVGVFRTNEWAPRVLIANSNLVGDWANWEQFRKLEAEGLTMYGQMTAGSWIYIGTPGHPAGHLRDLRRGGAQALRRDPRRDDHADRRCGRHGRRAAARGHHERRRRDLRRRRPDPHRPPDRARLPRRPGRRPSTTPSRWPSRCATTASRCRSAWSATPPRSSRPCSRWAPRSTSSPTRRPPTTRCPTCRSESRSRTGRRCREGPGRLHRRGPEVDGRTCRGDGRVPGRGRRGLRLRQLDPRRGPKGRLRPGIRVPRLRARLHPSALLRGPRPVPVGRALRRPHGHRGHRPGDPRAVPGERAAHALDHHGRREGALPGPAGPHLLARVRRAPPGRAASSTRWWPPASSRRRSSSAATTSTAARSPRRTGRPRPWPTAPTRSPTGRC